MSEPKNNITQLFQLEHMDAETKVHRVLDVMVDDQGGTYLAFTTQTPNEAPHQTVLPLSEIAMDMLYHALNTLQQEHGKYPNRYASIH